MSAKILTFKDLGVRNSEYGDRQVREMIGEDLTLSEVKKMAQKALETIKMPTALSLVTRLAEGFDEILKYSAFRPDCVLIVTLHGYVYYRAQGRATVFRLHGCAGSYQYLQASGDPVQVKEEYLENSSWRLRLFLEGEDRLAVNQDVRVKGKQVLYEDNPFGEENGMLSDRPVDGCRYHNMPEGVDALDQMIMAEKLERVFSKLSKNQRVAIICYFFFGETRPEIADRLGISYSGVIKLITRGLEKLRDERLWEE